MSRARPRPTRPPLPPLTRTEMDRLGWDVLDVLLVSGDAYVDHPSFGVAMLARVLQGAGFRVGVLSQPAWRSAEAFSALGRPRLFVGIGAGNVDSMLAHYTARRKTRSRDAYSPGGRPGRRPDRATAVYAQRCREALGRVPIVIGGIEASLRRLAHWDHWSRTVRPSMLVSSKADLLVYGMGERAVLDIARTLDGGGTIRDLRGRPGTCHLLGRRDAGDVPARAIEVPAFETCRDDPPAIAEVTRHVAQQANPWCGRPLVQRHGDRLVVQAPPEPPPSSADLDGWYGLPFTRREHPALGAPVPALETVRWSVVTHRGCVGGCSFCALAEHQGRHVTTRSRGSVLAELRRMAADRAFRGVVSDLGGPSADMVGIRCDDPERERRCRRRSCLHPEPCPHLDDDPRPWLDLLAASRAVRGVRAIRVASGVRLDRLLRHRDALDVLVRHHVGGQLKIAPEHDRPRPLQAMRKVPPGTLRRFVRAYAAACRRAGVERYLVPYLMSGHPGTSMRDMRALVEELRALGLRPRQVQAFTPTPMTLSTAQHVSGIDPLTRRAVAPVRGDRARDAQRDLLRPQGTPRRRR